MFTSLFYCNYFIHPFFSILFFSCSVANQHLHSFPTRRSSDLTAPPSAATPGESAPAFGAYLDYGPRGVTRMAELSQDRKSTRLNSSHVKISYAVFCLKKKMSDIVTRIITNCLIQNIIH